MLFYRVPMLTSLERNSGRITWAITSTLIRGLPKFSSSVYKTHDLRRRKFPTSTCISRLRVKSHQHNYTQVQKLSMKHIPLRVCYNEWSVIKNTPSHCFSLILMDLWVVIQVWILPIKVRRSQLGCKQTATYTLEIVKDWSEPYWMPSLLPLQSGC